MPIDTQVYQSQPAQPTAPSGGGIGGTIGSVLGGIGGALIPGLGETGLGEAGGAAAGGAIGQELQNLFTGTKDSTLGSAIGGGVGTYTGGLLGKALGGIGGGALGALEKATAPKIAADVSGVAAPAVEGSAQAAYDKPFTDALSDAASQTRLQKQGIQFQPVRDFMQNQMGASNDPKEWSKIANFIAGNPEGEGAYLSKQVANAAASQPDIPQSEVLNQLHGIAQSHGSSLIEPAETDTMGKWVAGQLKNAVADNQSQGGQDMYSSLGLQNLSKAIASRYAKNPLTMNPMAQTTLAKTTEHEALPEVKQFIDDLVNNRSGVNEAIAKDQTTGEQAAKIMAEAPTPQAGQYVIDALNNGQTAADLNAAARPAVQADKIAKEVINYQQGVKPVAEQVKGVEQAQTAADKEAQKAAAAESNKPHPAEKATQAIVKGMTGGIPQKLQAGAEVAGGIVPFLNKIAGGGASALNKLPLAQLSRGLGGAVGGGVGAVAGTPPSGAPGGNMQPVSNMMPGATLANGAATTNPNLLAQLDAMMSADPYLASSLAPQIQGLTGQVTAAQAAQQALDQYQNTLGAAGGGQGPVGGILARLSGLLTGGPANQVGPQQAALQQLLAKAGAPGLQVPGLYANQAGTAAGLAPAQSVLSALGG